MRHTSCALRVGPSGQPLTDELVGASRVPGPHSAISGQPWGRREEMAYGDTSLYECACVCVRVCARAPVLVCWRLQEAWTAPGQSHHSEQAGHVDGHLTHDRILGSDSLTSTVNWLCLHFFGHWVPCFHQALKEDSDPKGLSCRSVEGRAGRVRGWLAKEVPGLEGEQP